MIVTRNISPDDWNTLIKWGVNKDKDLLPKDGDEVLNTRSIGIIENGGILIQARNFNTDIFFPELSSIILIFSSFTSPSIGAMAEDCSTDELAAPPI